MNSLPPGSEPPDITSAKSTLEHLKDYVEAKNRKLQRRVEQQASHKEDEDFIEDEIPTGVASPLQDPMLLAKVR